MLNAKQSLSSAAVWAAINWLGVTHDRSVDQQTFHGRYLLALVSNIQLYAGGIATLSRGSKQEDGYMDL